LSFLFTLRIKGSSAFKGCAFQDTHRRASVCVCVCVCEFAFKNESGVSAKFSLSASGVYLLWTPVLLQKRLSVYKGHRAFHMGDRWRERLGKVQLSMVINRDFKYLVQPYSGREFVRYKHTE